MRKMMTLLSLAALLLPACAGSPPPSPGAPVSTVEQDGVRVTLQMDRERYAPGENIWARVRVENISRRPVRWVAGGCSLPAWVTARAPSLAQQGEEWPGRLGAFKRQVLAGLPDLARIPLLDRAAFEARQAGQAIYCTAAVREIELAPGGLVDVKFAWDGALPLPDGPRVAGGWTTFEAVVPIGRIDAPAPVTVRLQAAVDGGPAWLISPGEAVDSALHNERFRQRVLSRTAPELASGSVRFIGGEWQVRESERGLVAAVDPVIGKVTGLKESHGLKQP